MEVDRLPDGRPLAQLSLAEIKEQCALRNLSKTGSRKDLTDRLKLRLELEKLREEASRALAKEDVVPNIGLQDTPVGQSDIVRQYLEAQQRRLLLFGVHRPHFENTAPIQETTPSDERKRPIAQKTKGSLKQNDLLGNTPGATRDLSANADGQILDDLEETTSSVKATRGRSANHKLKVDETPVRKKTRYNSNDASNSIPKALEDPTSLGPKRRRVVRGSPIQADGLQSPTTPLDFTPQGAESKEGVKRGRGRPRKIKETPTTTVPSTGTLAAHERLSDPKVDFVASGQAQITVKADVDEKPIVLVPDKEDNRSTRAKRLRSQEETPQTLQERARVPPPASSADPALSEASLEDPIEAALLALHGVEDATKSPKRRNLPLENLDDECSQAQDGDDSDRHPDSKNQQANTIQEDLVDRANPSIPCLDVAENGDMLPRSATGVDSPTAETAASRERSKAVKPAKTKETPPVARESSKLVEEKESKEVFAKKSVPVPGSPRPDIKRTAGNERTVRETRKRSKVENIVQKLTQDKVEAADIAAKAEASLAKRPRKENGQAENLKLPDASPPSSGVSPDDCVLRLLGAGPKLEKSDKRPQDTPKTSKEKKAVPGSPRDKRTKDVIPVSTSPTSRRTRRGLSGEGIDTKPESETTKSVSVAPDATTPIATIDLTESGRRDSVEAAVAALIGEPLEPRTIEETAVKRATRKTSRDIKHADEHQQQHLQQQQQQAQQQQQQQQAQQQQQQQQSLPAAVSQPSTRSSRSLRSRETSTEAETVGTDCAQVVSPTKEKLQREPEAPIAKTPEAEPREEQKTVETKPVEPKVEIALAVVVEGPPTSKLEQVVAKCETRRTSAGKNSSESKQSKIIEDIKVEQSIKPEAAVAVASASVAEAPETSGEKLLKPSVEPPKPNDGEASTEAIKETVSAASELQLPQESPIASKDDASITKASESLQAHLEQTTHNNAVASISTGLSATPGAPEASESEDTDGDPGVLKIVENDKEPVAQQSQEPECVVVGVEKSSSLPKKSAEDLGDAHQQSKEQESQKIAEPAIANHLVAENVEKPTEKCDEVEKGSELEPVPQVSALLEGNKDIASDIEQEVSSKPQPEQDDLWEAVFCGDQEGNPSSEWPEVNDNEDPSSSYRQSDLLDDSETNIGDTPGIKLPHKFQPNVESAVASILDLNDMMRPSSSLSSHGGQNDNDTAVIDNVPDADSAVAGLLSEVPFDDEGDHADLCIDDEVVSEAVPQEYDEVIPDGSTGVFDQEPPNPPNVGEVLQEISTCKETPERRISEEVRSVTGDVVESVATTSLLVDVTEQQHQQTTPSPKSTEQTSSVPLGPCSKLLETSPAATATEPVRSPPRAAIEERPAVKDSVNLSEESSSDSDSEDLNARSKARPKQRDRGSGQAHASKVESEPEAPRRKTAAEPPAKASSVQISGDKKTGDKKSNPSAKLPPSVESSSSSSSSSSGASSSESSSSDDDDEENVAERVSSKSQKPSVKSVGTVRAEQKSQKMTAKEPRADPSTKQSRKSDEKDSTHGTSASESLKAQSEGTPKKQKTDKELQKRVEGSVSSHETRKPETEKQTKQRKEDAESSTRRQAPKEELRRQRKEEAEELRQQQEEKADLLRKKQEIEADELRKQQQEDAEALRKQQNDEDERARLRLEEEEKLRQQKEAEEKLRQEKEAEVKLRQQKEAEEELRRQKEAEEKLRQKKEAEEKLRQQKEAEEKMRQEQENQEKKRLKEEEELRKRREKEEETRKQLEEEEKARKMLEEEEKARKLLAEEEERARKRIEEAEKARRQLEEEEKERKRLEEEEKEQARLAEEERLRKLREEEEKARKQLEEEERARKLLEEEERLRKRLEEEEMTRRRLEEEVLARKRKEEEEEAARKQQEETMRLQKEREEEQEIRRREQEEEDRLRKLAEEELRRKQEAERISKEQEAEHRRKEQKAEEERLRKEEEAKKLSLERQDKEEKKRKQEKEESLRKQQEEKNSRQKQEEEEKRLRKEREESERLRKQREEQPKQEQKVERSGEQNKEDQEKLQRQLKKESATQKTDGALQAPDAEQQLLPESAEGSALTAPGAEASCSTESSAFKASTSSNDASGGSRERQPTEQSSRGQAATGMMVGSISQQRKNPLVSYGFDSEDEDDEDGDDASEAVAKDNPSKSDPGNPDVGEASCIAPPRSAVAEQHQDAAESSGDFAVADVSAAKSSDDSGGVQVSSSHTTGVFTHSVASPGLIGGVKKFEVTSSSDNPAEVRSEVPDDLVEASSGGLEGDCGADKASDAEPCDQGLAAPVAAPPNDCSPAANQAETASSSDESGRSLDEGSQRRLHSHSAESASSSSTEMTSTTDRPKNQNPQDGASSSSDGLNTEPPSGTAGRTPSDEIDSKTCVASSSPTQTTADGTEQSSQQPSSDDACSSSDKLPKVDCDDPTADTSDQDLRQTEVQSSSEASLENPLDASSSSDKKDCADSYADSSSPQQTTSNDRVESRIDGEGAPSSSDQQTPGTADSRKANSAEVEPDSDPVRASVESSEEASELIDDNSVDASDDPTLPKCCSSSTASVAERSSAPVEEFESGRPRCESTSETNRTSRLDVDDDDDDFEENSQPELPGACTSSHSQQHSSQHATSEQADPLSNAADEDKDISSSNNNNNNIINNSSSGGNENNNNNSSSNANNPATSEASSAEVDAAKNSLSTPPEEKISISSSDAQSSQRPADFSLDESSGMAQSSDEPRAQMLASPSQDYGSIPDGNEVSASSSSSSATGENRVNTSSSGDKDSPAPTPSSSSCKPDVKLSLSSSVEDVASSEAIPMEVDNSKDAEPPSGESSSAEENADSCQEDENPSSSSAGPSNKESKEPSSS